MEFNISLITGNVPKQDTKQQIDETEKICVDRRQRGAINFNAEKTATHDRLCRDAKM